MTRRRRRTVAWLAAVCLTVSAATACSDDPPRDASSTTTTSPVSSGGPSTTAPNSGAGDAPVQDVIRVEVLSSQPDRVSGPDARIRVWPASRGSVDDLRVEVDGRDVTTQLSPVDGALEGVISGLVEGTNSVTASGGGETVTQRLRSWPLTGPMISGPQTPLLACSTEEHGLGAPSDDHCSAPTRVTWKYLSGDDELHDLTDPSAPLPDDVATAAVAGKDVPLVIRHEVGVVNRSIYELATVDPSPADDADNDDVAWNRRLVYRFGDGCGATYGQGAAAPGALSAQLLRAGYAVATASFNTGAVQCNDVVSSETAMMVTERFIETFGVPDQTIGEGRGFGGSQVLLTIQNYPGLLDGAAVADAFPDVVTTLNVAADCGLLDAYYSSPSAAGLSEEQRAAIDGHATAATCEQWVDGYGSLVDPAAGCDPKIPAGELYGTANPEGVRCTVEDTSITQFGTDEATGHGLRLVDNVGLQYGLDALNAGTISFDQFIDLNTRIGGFDVDGAIQVARHEADPIAVQTAYETGRVSSGTGDQKKVPIVAVDHFDDDQGGLGDQHWLRAQRYRLTYGDHPDVAPGFQIWTRTRSGGADDALHDAVASVDEWLDALASSPGRDRITALKEGRPQAAVDRCSRPEAPDDRGRDLSGVDVYDLDIGDCDDAYPAGADPRVAAGAPETAAVIKCALKPVDPSDYDIRVGDAEYQLLLQAFPSGVCDWTSPGVGQTIPSMADRTYEDVESPADKA